MKDVADDLAFIVRNSIAYIKELEAELARCKQVCAATAEAWREEAALAEPVQEPVAWVECDGELVWNNREAAIGRNLYTSPPQRKPPATIDEMFDRMDKAPKGVFFGHDPMTIWMEAWRAAEQQHGIK